MTAIIDYGVGNLFSLLSSLEAVGAEAAVTSSPELIAASDRMILPGVGAFGDAAAKLGVTGLGEVVKEQAAKGKPVLGICRGCQVINVAYGGTLNQHIGRHKGFRTVRNVKGWWMYDMYGKYHSTYHSNHQVVGRLGKNLIATAYDSNSGHIEAIQHETLPVYGIQWHPDMKMGNKGLKTFKEFRKICEANKASK